uniref:Uncharacterized protein n=1 Tax=Sus scrofa TaxID=9823 RepID=A0A8D1V6B5_PIG
MWLSELNFETLPPPSKISEMPRIYLKMQKPGMSVTGKAPAFGSHGWSYISELRKHFHDSEGWPGLCLLSSTLLSGSESWKSWS